MLRSARCIALAALLAAGCRGVVVDRVPIDLVLPDAPECRDALGPIALTALGDFSTTDLDVAQLDDGGAPITRFPTSTLAFSAGARATSAGWDAFGWAMRGAIEARPTLVMRPLGVSCPLSDPEAHLPRGAAIAALDESTLMFVGGVDDVGDATRRVAILRVQSEHVELPAVARVIPIAFAAATLLPEGDAVLVTGGASSDGGEGRDTWERIPIDGGTATFGSLGEGRRDHTAIAVDAGAVHGVLLVGGSDGTRLLSSIEWVDPTSDTGATLTSRLSAPRRAPLLVPLDEKRIAIVSGVDASGASTVIDVLDLASDTLDTLSLGLGAPDWIAPLPAGRLAWASGGSLSIVSLADRTVVGSVASLPAVPSPVAVALPTGRVLLEGGLTTGTRMGFRIDPGTATITPVSTSRVPTTLVPLADGTTLELTATGASLRRDERTTPFDAPPPSYLFAADQGVLALDAAPRWAVTHGTLVPAPGVDAARLDVPVLRMRHFQLTIDGTGSFDVLLTGEHLEPLATIAVTPDAVSAGSCTTARPPGSVRVARGADGSLSGTLSGCPALAAIDPSARLGFAIVAHEGAALRSLALQRDPG